MSGFASFKKKFLGGGSEKNREFLGNNPYAEGQCESRPWWRNRNTSTHASIVADKAFVTTASTPSDAPPLYTRRVLTENDAFASLASFDTVLIIDDSGSMSGQRWAEAEAALQAISDIVTVYDEDGIDIYFLNHKSPWEPPANKNYMARGGYYGIDNNARPVSDIFRQVRPEGYTPTARTLEEILNPYLQHLSRASDMSSVKPLNLIVITDGVPTDNPTQSIVNAANALDRLLAPSYQVGIQFVQIGNDKDATRALKQLDDNLQGQGHARDIVDTVTCKWGGKALRLTDSSLLKTVLGAVDKRLDNQKSGGKKRRR
jgi:uncharacterized protein YegL